ncbi:MDR family NADP-dependent oxidoreductase [Novosphingobium cyanobacteriorum]|uniref:NADP-dependent oxidoreductase n=1 Tax=Novosphingobium cyanobacteriorum TaxID=3024215 RepID=A0ABT6CNE2_9SPHN|nr:NADP-dependent oxidoreductase [Novosphingobium cyanobacteriorum]MDF8334605.1 NADP-dependent oxidoreductase [Novosphingobium cyanobacteriorum]
MITAIGIRLVTPSAGVPERSDFAFEPFDVPDPREGEIVIRTIMISVDPYLMMPMRSGGFPEGRIRSRVIARVEASAAPDHAVGDLVLGFSRWQERECVSAAEMRRLDPVVPLSAYLGIAGHSGFTAMIGMRLLDPQPGQTVVVSSAAGMVGLVACQLAREAGARVVAIAGGDKARRVADLFALAAGVDHAAPNFAMSLAAACPDGIDRHFENVGAKILDPVLAVANDSARIALCGLIQHYGDDAPVCLANFRSLLMKGISIHPFSIYRHGDDYPAALRELEAKVVSGALRAPETIHEGFETTPDAFRAMMEGDGIGKHLVKLAD